MPIRLSMLRLGDTVIGGVDGEVFTEIGLRFKRASPYKHSIMATLTNGFGPSGYIASDAASGYATFEVVSSKLTPRLCGDRHCRGPSRSHGTDRGVANRNLRVSCLGAPRSRRTVYRDWRLPNCGLYSVAIVQRER